jgi:uncharacterized iron-regulated membrane protein
MIRRYLIWQHRWAGLLMTVFLVIVGITGSILAYRDDVDRLLNPQLFASPVPGAKALDLATLAERAEAIAPQAKVWYMYVNSEQASIRCVPRTNPATGKPYEIGFDHLILNPWTGEELGRLSEYSISHVDRVNFTSFIYDLHTSMTLGSFGWSMVGYVALVWTIDCFVGFYLTLPVGLGKFLKRWKYAWWVKWRASAMRVNFDLHRASGLWLWPLLFVFAWSGVMFNMNSFYERVTQAAFDYQSIDAFIASIPAHPHDNPKLDWRAALARAEQLMAQQAATHRFTVERPAGLAFIAESGVYSYTVQSSRDFRHGSPDTGVFLDGDTGEFRALSLPSGEHTGNTISNLLWALHYGDIYGLRSYRFLVCITGLLIAMLSGTGVYIWLKKFKTRRLTAAIRRRAAAGQLSKNIAGVAAGGD